MPPRLLAVFLLTWGLVRTFFRRLFSRPSGVVAFRRNYDADGLPPVSEDERVAMEGFGKCIACGLCDHGEAPRIAESGGAYRGIMALMLSGARSMPDYRAAAYSFRFVPKEVLLAKERICPTGVPIARIASFVQDKAAQVGGPLPLPERVDSLPPERLSGRPVSGVSPRHEDSLLPPPQLSDQT